MLPGSQQYIISASQKLTYNAWTIDPSWSGYIYDAWYTMYGLTIVPSFDTMLFIYVVKAFVSIYLYVDMVLKVLGLGFHPAKESFNWIINNWWVTHLKDRLLIYYLLLYTFSPSSFYSLTGCST